MDIDYVASKLSRLPQFTVSSVTTDTEGAFRFQGSFSGAAQNNVCGGSFFLPNGDWFEGELSAISSEKPTYLVKISSSWPLDLSPDEVAGRTFALFGRYDLRHLNLALNQEIQWDRLQLNAEPAVATLVEGTDGKMYRKLTLYVEGSELPERATIVEQGWDHEHCIFCRRNISEGDVGYRSAHGTYGDEWVCAWCYDHAVSKHELLPLTTDYKTRT